jgi:hypothetical protein
MEYHTVHSNGSAATSRASCGGIPGGKVHLRHEPAAKNVSRRVGISRHRNRSDDGITGRRLGWFWHDLH